ncbi:RNA helicase [Bertholletia excelsa]
MPTVATTQFLILVRDVFPLRKLPQLSKRAPFFGSVRYFSQVGRENAPLTLASLGLKSDLEALNKRRKNDIQRLEAANEGSKSKVKPIRSAVVKDARVKKSLQIGEAPFAAVSFSELGLTPLLLERLEKEGFDVPTDVQSTAIPVILKNHDVVIQSYTGSGKTLAYLLPILSDVGPLKKKRPNGEESGKKMEIEAVIVAPSRELGMQIVRELEKLLGPENRKLVQQLVGGANRSRQEEALKKNKPAIVVGTPGRIAEISAAGKLHTHGCSYLVLDEVDELLKFHFREDMHRILEHVGKRSGANPHSPKGPQVRQAERQTIMVSATVPFSVIRAARSWGKDPLLVQAKKVTPIDLVVPSEQVNLSGNPSASSSGPSSNVQNHGAITSLPPNLKHYYCITRLQHKVDSLRRCVHALDAKAAIVFMNNTKQLKDAVYKLEARGINAAELHGDLGKLARSTILKKFKNGEVRVLVTNELSARGLDVVDCDLVVSLDLPTDAIHYAHRAGRTGRLGRMGTVLTVCEESELFVIKKLQKQLGISIQAYRANAADESCGCLVSRKARFLGLFLSVSLLPFCS